MWMSALTMWCGAVAIKAQDPAPPSDAGTFLDAPEFKADPSTAVFRRVCVLCHTPERIITGRRSGLEWGEIIDKMLTKGAKGSDEELQTVFLFLVSHFGKVNVNAAPADEIAAVLGVSPEAGQAVVKARADQGRFQSLDALAKVPGLDLSKLNPDAVVFN
jgi:competence ComEA-like helix-hairpin-helix protein